jgi:hypothetical protein
MPKEKVPIITIITGTLIALFPCVLAYGLTMPDITNGVVTDHGISWTSAIWIIVASLPGILWLAYANRTSRRGARICGIIFLCIAAFFIIFSLALVGEHNPDDPAIQVVAATAGWFLLFGLAFIILGRHIHAPATQFIAVGAAASQEAGPISPTNPGMTVALPLDSSSAKPAGFTTRIVVFSALVLVAAAASSLPSLPPGDKYKVLLGLALLGLIAAGLVPASVISDLAKVFSKSEK